MRNKFGERTWDEEDALRKKEIEDVGGPGKNRTPEKKIEEVEPDEESPEEAEAEMQEVRERIKDMPDIKQKKDENDNEEQAEKKQYSGEDLFEKAREEKGGVEEVMRLSIIGNVSEKISNTKKSQEVRDKTAERKVLEVIKALEEIYGDLENMKENVEIILDIGSGWGENLRDLAKKLEAKKAIGVDQNTIYSEKVNEELGDKLAWVKRDAMEAMGLLEKGAIKVSSAFAFLQIFNDEEKIKILKKMGEVTKEAIIIVDELKRSGLDGLKDLLMNKLYNAGMGKYEVLSEDGWKEIFKKAGLAVEVFNKFGNNDFVAVLKKAEQMEKVK